jgi:hypothetical protein
MPLNLCLLYSCHSHVPPIFATVKEGFPGPVPFPGSV